MDPTAPAKSCVCSICQEKFDSKTKMFKHLQVHGYSGPNAKPDRVILLVGWLAEYQPDMDEWTSDMSTTSAGREFCLDQVELALYRAIYTLENGLESTSSIPPEMEFERPKGSSRASSVVQRSSMLLGVEATCHAQCDTFCLNMRPYISGTGEEWLDKVNSFLPDSVRVLNRYVLSSEMSPKDLHAEVSCTQYRYEYMLPLRLLMPASAKTTALSGENGEEDAGVEKWLQQSVVRRKVYHPSEKNISNNGAYSMDQQFPFETVEGQQRVAFFRNLKRISKTAAGRKTFHNFASGGASPEDTVSVRKIDRIYHKELVSINNEPWVVFSISGDSFLRGQVRRVLGVMVAVARGLLPESYFEACVEKSTIAEVPALPGWGLYLAECKYAYYEAKFEDFRLDPRRISGADRTRMDSWKTAIHTHISQISTQVGDGWLTEFESSCQQMLQRHEQMRALMSRPRNLLEKMYREAFSRDPIVLTSVNEPRSTDLGAQRAGSHDCSVPAVYAKVLRLLQEADASGLWPANSTGRQKVILNAPAVVPTAPSEGDLNAMAESSVDSLMPEGEYERDETTQSRLNGEESAQSGKNDRKVRSGNNNRNGKNKKVKTSRSPGTEVEKVDRVALHDDKGTEKAEQRKKNKTEGSTGNPAHQSEMNRPPLQPAHRKIEEIPVELVSDAGVGGSFSVGCLPKHLAQPKGNQLFPELMKACFELEKALCPNRTPSSTIAINRHAQFSPHRDSGAGNGQSTSLIVALGDFVGGEIAVENTAHDIRYQPLEFNGWLQRHWTLPFVGQRFSLVWFTPLGITEDDLWWWKE